jgi:Zn-dependent M28 family amino/carboxypeptidase
MPSVTRLLTLAVIALALMLAGCGRLSRPPQQFDGKRAMKYAQAQCDFGPRTLGSEAHAKTRALIRDTLREAGWQVEVQQFQFRGQKIRNLIGKRGNDKGGPVLIGAHYDTRPVADRDLERRDGPIIGGNDGASGVAVMLELARVLSPGLSPPVWLTFFDAEDLGDLDGWPFAVGATHLARSLTVTPTAVIVLDMIGDADLQIYQEGNSNPQLTREIWEVAARLGYGDAFIPRRKWTMIDDHIPFLQRGFVAVDLIDFDYPYWHTHQDTCDKISSASLEKVGRVVQAWLSREGQGK